MLHLIPRYSIVSFLIPAQGTIWVKVLSLWRPFDIFRRADTYTTVVWTCTKNIADLRVSVIQAI